MIYCSFCSKRHAVDGVGVIAGPTVNICNECTELCCEIFAESEILPSPSGACGLALEHGRLLAEAANLWARGHGSRVCAAACPTGSDACEICGERNPYRS